MQKLTIKILITKGGIDLSAHNYRIHLFTVNCP